MKTFIRKWITKLVLAPPKMAYRTTIASLPQAPSVSDAAGDTSWIVSIQYNAPAHDKVERHTVAGVLIAPTVVATVAHAFDDRAVIKDKAPIPVADMEFFVRVGSTDLTGGTRMAIRHIVPHPQFTISRRRTAHDLALLILDEAVDAPVLPIDFSGASIGDEVRVFGWPQGSDGTGTLQQATTSLIHPGLCKLGGIAAGDICAANLRPDVAIGGGYSGGPVVRTDDQGRQALIGIASHGAGALAIEEAGPPGIFTSTMLNEGFLKHAIDGSHTEEPSPT